MAAVWSHVLVSCICLVHSCRRPSAMPCVVIRNSSSQILHKYCQASLSGHPCQPSALSCESKFVHTDDRPLHLDTRHQQESHRMFMAQIAQCFACHCQCSWALLCRDALSSGLPGLTFVGYSNSTSVSVGYGIPASEPLLPCSTASTTVPPPFTLHTQILTLKLNMLNRQPSELP